ncbi:hypothetical protein CGRA01v4_14041 [Colletotrichum graminicola]|uniref:Uncharacterized protein n=1 Tax=Colletotrichum graminicola (strain M1.001 / M2 / FGSC 10212) TaxID=645133 RepID=E3QUR9_COLGM|nr:uncharacterized protein GLRG_09751 [Colletotrichum graminicola M1.001]EFQ34607.1 hypothetical protein GLRG_09751 [Colletotrichum graminicola M1.001]WDK22751.1 hypothetical protein CGRA01v4_14041 [Colletotrichum graminicola]
MPDLNSVPASPHPQTASRRSSSHQIPPPPLPSQSSNSSSLNILPSNQNIVNHPNPSVGSPPMAPSTVASLPAAPEPSVSGPGPIRHPRPITASELHMQLEKEQEAVVNRLTRELQLLRTAQNASVVSNASSTSASNTTEGPDTHLLSGAAFSTPSVPSNSSRQHHRTASNASTRSQTAVAGSAAVSTASMPVPRPANPVRQDSVASRHSLSSSPAPSSHYLDPSGGGLTYFQQQRLLQQNTGSASVAHTPGGSELQLSPGLMPTTSRYEETALHRQELENAKKENEALKQRIRDLEKLVREQTAGRERSGSTGSAATGTATSAGVTTGGAGIAGPRRPGGERERSSTTMSVASSVAVGVPDEELQVGESAASSGLNP